MKKQLRTFFLTVLAAGMAGTAWAEEHYLVGGCTPSGWNLGSARANVAMMSVGNNTWTWCGKLTVGDNDNDNGRFKIPSSVGGWDGYWAPAQNTLLTAEWSDLSTNSSGDNKYRVGEAGIYKITINTSTLKIKAEKMTEPSKDGDYYLIGSIEDYYWFAGAASSDNTALKARLTADLDFTEKGFFPVGAESDEGTWRFAGEFDGQGHTMTIALPGNAYNNLAPFRAINGATIKNLKMAGEIETSGYQMGGLVSITRGSSSIQNVLVATEMTSSHSGDGTHGGVVAVAHDVPTIQNVAFVGSINAPANYGTCGMIGYAHSGGSVYYTNCFVGGTLTLTGTNNRVFGRNGEHCTNCYTTITDMTKLNDADRFNGSDVSAAQVASGELTYKLNGNSSDNVEWYQAIGTDVCPVPFGSAVVYANGDLYCDGTSKGGALIYSNANESNRDSHHFNEWGFCDNKPNGIDQCNELNTNFMSPNAEGYYEIGTKQELNWFAVRVNGHNTYHSSLAGVRNINAKLTADIDFSDQTNMIGGDDNATGYQGTFDGQEHSVKLGYAISQKNVALFRTISSAHIMNLITTGTLNNENNSCTGGIFAGSHGASIVENCVSYVAINRTNGGDATIGGIGAYMHDNGSIKNCAFYGSINAEASRGNGGILGYANGGSNTTLTNCLVAPTVYTKNGDSEDFARNNPTITNCFIVAGNDASLATGELAYMMNESIGETVWFQKLGTDDADVRPLPFGTYVVYANGFLYCDGTTKPGSLYENENKGMTRDDHHFNEWGFCSNAHDDIICNALQPDFMTAVEGTFSIENEKQLNWFAHYVCAGNLTDNVKLMNDINMAGVNGFAGIGNESNAYKGTFDGQRHHIKNMTINGNANNFGFFRMLGGGAKVMNLTLDATCSIKADGKERVGGFVGGITGSNGEVVEFLNCGNEAYVSSHWNTSGFVGCNASDVKVCMTNCYNTGTIKGDGDCGAMSGWLNKGAILRNCYNMGEVDGSDYFVRLSNGSGESLTNCFDTKSTWAVLSSTKEGANAFNIETVFTTCFDDEKGGDVWRMEFAGTAHPVLYDAAIVLKENFPNRIVAAENVDLTLERTTVADVWNTICLPFALDATQVETVFGTGAKVAELTGAEGETLNFTTTTTIEAGKAYLVKPTEAITEKELTVDLEAAAPVATEQGGFAFTGIYGPTLISEGDLFVAAGNKLQPSDGTGKLKGFRAYLHKKADGARAISFTIDEVVTGIMSLDGTVMENGTIYTIGGQRVVNPSKGLYIVNGKKQIFK